MNKLFKNIALLIIVLVYVASAEEPTHEIVFDRISVNGRLVDGDSILISDKDTINFQYYCKKGDADDSPFLFRIELRNHDAEQVRSWNETTISYHHLPKGEYKFSVYAFDVKRNWQTAVKSYVFEVDSEKLNLISELKNKNDKLPKEEASQDGIKKWVYIIGSFLVGAIFIGIVSAFWRPKTKTDPSEIRQKMEKSEALNEKMSYLQQENENLKIELSALRSQIEGLQRRTDEMKSRNRELENNILRISETKEELENLQNQKDELFAMLIHDIKNPAGIIKSLVELLKGYDLSAIDQQQVIDDIVLTSKKIVQLSQEVSRVLALESGNLFLNKQEIDLQELARTVHNRFKIKAAEKSIMLMFDENTKLPLVEADENKLDEVLSNLISNAVKFTQNGGSVRVKGQQIDNSIVFEISDNGQGLTQDDLQKAFKRGAQLSAKPTAGESSTGLGLWIVKKLVEAHDGRVWVRSTVGKGSTFGFSIPLSKEGSKSDFNLKFDYSAISED